MNKKEAYDILIKLLIKRNRKNSKLRVQFIWTSCLFWLGKYEVALRYINGKWGVNDIIQASCWKGVLYYFLKDYNSAVHFLKKAEYAHPSVLEIKYFLAETFFAMSDIQKAKAKYRALVSNSEFKIIGLYGVGCCLLKANRPNESLGFLNKALMLSKYTNSAEIFNRKGLCLMELKMPEKARFCFEECLKISPNNIEAQLNLALALGKLKKYKKAANIYKRILNKAPHNMIAINNYASCMATCNAYDVALKYCNIGLNIDPSNTDLLINKSYCLYELRHYSSALECLNEAEKIIKDDIILCNNKVLCLIALEKYDDALKYLNGLLNKGSSDDLLFHKAYCLVKKGLYNEALICLETIKNKNKKTHDFYMLKGVCFERLGDNIAAVECFNKSLITA